MKLVLLFFCATIGFLLLIILLGLLSSMKLNVKRCYFSNLGGNTKKKTFDKKVEIYVEFYLLGILKIARIKLKKKMFQKLNRKMNPEELKKDVKIIKPLHPLKLLKKLKMKTEKLNVDLVIGTEDVIFTSYLTGVISSLIRNHICSSKP